MTDVRAAELEIAREIERVQDEAYGGATRKIDVQVVGDVVVVILDVELNRAEQTLADAGFGDSVQKTRQDFQAAIAPTFRAIVERATGRSVEMFASKMEMDPPWSAEIFRLAPAGSQPS